MTSSRRATVSWALYDWANSAFATTVIAGFFPVFFKTFWAEGLGPTGSTLRLGLAASAASIVVAMLAPVLGAIADRSASRRRFLLFFAGAGVVSTAALPLVSRGAWPAALGLYTFGVVAWSAANVFYDALLVSVAEERRLDRVSALGYALGYLGGGLIFGLNVLMTVRPALFGLADAAQAVQVSFLAAALWWAVFSLPLALFVPEPGGHHRPAAGAVRAGLAQLASTFRRVRALRPVFLFLVAYWLYIDGVDTVIRMAVDYGLALGFPQQSLVLALLITQAVGFPAALAFGWIGERLGSRTGILVGVGVYMGVTVWGAQMEEVWEFYALAATVGLVQGGVQALSRAFYARLIPAGESAEFFGFYNVMGRLAAVIGPALMGIVAALTGSPRIAILSILVLFAGGAALLLRVPDPQRSP